MELIARNEPDQVKCRKYRNILDMSGKGVIIFCIWSAIRVIAYYIINPINADDYSLGTTSLVIVYIILAIILGIDILFRLIVGMGARGAARGKKKGIGYIIVAFFLLALSIFSVITFFMSTYDLMQEGVAIASLIVEIVSIVILVELIKSSIIVRKSVR